MIKSNDLMFLGCEVRMRSCLGSDLRLMLRYYSTIYVCTSYCAQTWTMHVQYMIYGFMPLYIKEFLNVFPTSVALQQNIITEMCDTVD